MHKSLKRLITDKCTSMRKLHFISCTIGKVVASSTSKHATWPYSASPWFLSLGAWPRCSHQQSTVVHRNRSPNGAAATLRKCQPVLRGKIRAPMKGFCGVWLNFRELLFETAYWEHMLISLLQNTGERACLRCHKLAQTLGDHKVPLCYLKALFHAKAESLQTTFAISQLIKWNQLQFKGH